MLNGGAAYGRQAWRAWLRLEGRVFDGLRSRRWAWQQLLPLLPAATALLLFATIYAAIEQTIGRELESRAQARVDQAAKLFANDVSAMLDALAVDLNLFSDAADLKADRNQAVQRQALERLKAQVPGFFWIALVSPQGVVLASTDGLLEGQSIASRPVFLEGRMRTWIGAAHAPVLMATPLQALGREVPREVADLATPVDPGIDGRVLSAHLDVSHLHRLRDAVLGNLPARHDLELALIDRDGRAVFGNAKQPPADRGALLLARVPVPAPRQYAALNWRVVACQPLASAMAPVNELRRNLMLLSAAAALLLGGAAMWMARRMARPLSEMLDMVGERLGPNATQDTASYLRAIAEQLRRMPPHQLPRSPGERMLDQLLQDAERLQRLLHQLPMPMYMIDAQRRIAFWNRNASTAFGWPAEAALGRTLDEVQPGVEQGAASLGVLQRLRSEAGPWRFEHHTQRRDGSAFHGEWHLSKVLDIAGEFTGVLVLVRDLTPAHEAEQQRREQAQVLAGIVDTASDAILSVDTQGRVTLFNPAAERVFGRSRTEMLGQPLDRLLPAGARDTHRADLQRFGQSQTMRRPMGKGPVRGLHASGAELQLEASISQVMVGGRLVLTAMLRDVTERVRHDSALRRYRQELSELTRRLITHDEATTQHLAQVLHDGLGQTLVAAQFTAEALQAAMRERWPADQAARAERLLALVTAAQAEVRGALITLRPPLLEQDGLAAALETEVRSRTATQDGPRLLLHVDDNSPPHRWPAAVEHAAFMVAREAIANAMRHARAGEVVVELRGGGHGIELQIEDDGVGFDTEQPPPAGHLGMVGMRERALAAGATLRVASRIGGGTQVSFSWQAQGAAAR